LDFPAENFVAFFANHRLLQYDRPVWRTVKGGSQRYVEKLTASFRDRIRLGCAVTAIERTAHGVVVRDSHGKTESYDRVVIASHSDQALAMLSDADDRERAILGAIRYSPNTIYLHRDPALMPKRRRAWASWNFLRWPRQGGLDHSVDNDVSVTYWMNELQGIDPDKPLFVSLNPPVAPDPALTFGKYLCEHPQYNAAAFCRPKTLARNSGLATYLVRRRMDRIRIPRGRIAIRPCGRRSARRGGATGTGGSGGIAMRASRAEPKILSMAPTPAPVRP
jgi:predicted NAD/FAD-binding protein